jgi:alpha-N-arabinofuranosidase
MEEMSDWVEYCNLTDQGKFAKMRIENGYPEPHNVKYWSIGNENYGFWEMGAKTKETWGDLVRESGKLMLNVDPTLKLFAAAVDDPEWTKPLLEKAGHVLEYVSIHGYWDRLHHINEPADYMQCMMYTMEPEKQIIRTIDIIEEAGFKDRLSIAFDEWNLRGWHHPWHGDPFRPMDIEAREKNLLNETYTMADAVFSACFLNSCLRQSKYVKMANMSPIVNTRGPLYVYPDGIVKRTTYHIFKMYTHYLESNYLPSMLSSESFTRNEEVLLVDAVVTCSDDMKNYSVVLINKHPEKEIDFTVNIDGIPDVVDAIVLAGDSPDAYNDVDAPHRVVLEMLQMNVENGNVKLSPHSINIIRFSVN